jgi:hypothetical protein
MFPHRHLDLRAFQPLLAERRIQVLTVLEQNGRRSLDQPAPDPGVDPEPGDQTVDDQEDGRGYQAPLHREVRARHRVLHRIRYQQNHHEVENGHLRQFSLSHEAKANQNPHVNEQGSSHYLEGARAHLSHLSSP